MIMDIVLLPFISTGKFQEMRWSLLGKPLTINLVKYTTTAKGLKDTLSFLAMPDPSDQKQDIVPYILGHW